MEGVGLVSIQTLELPGNGLDGRGECQFVAWK